MNVEDRLRQAILNAQIPLFGIAKPVRPVHFDQYLAWLSAGGHAGMAYLAQPGSIFKRSEPVSLMDGARSVLVFGFPYPRSAEERISLQAAPFGRIAAYAAARDYHTLIPEILEKLIPEITAIVGRTFQYRIFTDSAPILERDMARSAGLGWIGRNGCLISPQVGSFFFLAEMFCDLDLLPSAAYTAGHCGACRRCIEACPAGCIHDDLTIDSAKCISYLTIENRQAVPLPSRPALGSWLFGCDICQQVCPWNQKHTALPSLPEFSIERLPEWIDLHQALRLTGEQFKLAFRQYPILRAKRSGFLRNALVLIGNSRRPESAPLLQEILINEQDTLLRGHAAWAFSKCANSLDAASFLQRRLQYETDAGVREEIQLALSSL